MLHIFNKTIETVYFLVYLVDIQILDYFVLLNFVQMQQLRRDNQQLQEDKEKAENSLQKQKDDNKQQVKILNVKLI